MQPGQRCLPPARPERGDDLCDFLIGRAARVDRHDSRLVRGRLLQRVELAAQQRGRHVFMVACCDPRRDQRLRAFDVDEGNVRPRRANAIAIGALERGAGQYARLALTGPAFELLANPVEPGPAVGVGQGRSLPHLLDIGRRMQPVALHERPAELFGEQLGDGRLAAARHAHDDQGGSAFGAVHRRVTLARERPRPRPARGSVRSFRARRRRRRCRSTAQSRPPGTRAKRNSSRRQRTL